MKRRLTILLLCVVCVPCLAQTWAGVLAASRGYTWSNAGLPVTITYGSGGSSCNGSLTNCVESPPNPWTPPTRVQCGSTINPSGDTSGATDYTNINNAGTSCKPGTFVLLASGHFYINNTIYLSAAYGWANGVTMRGSGAQASVITPLGGSGGVHIGAGGGSSSCQLTSGSNYAAGSTTITCPTGTLPAVGDMAWLDQCDDGWSGTSCNTGSYVDTNSVYVCGNAANAPCQTDTGGGSTPQNQEQLIFVTSVNTGTGVIGILPGLIMPNWHFAKTPQLSWQGNATALGNGVEDITFDMTQSTSGSAAQFTASYASWWKGTRIIGTPPNRTMALGPRTLNGLFSNNYLYCQNPAAFTTGQYWNCFEQGSSSGGDTNALVLNNIVQGGTSDLGGGKETGNVLAYNHFREPGTSDYLYEFMHNPETDFFLREGNQGGNSEDDDTWGTHNFDTWYRNYYPGYDPPYYSTSGGGGDPAGIKLDSYARFENAIGNVIWGPLLTTYQVAGNFNDYVFNFGATDTLNTPTSMRWGNCDNVNNGCRFVSGEVPSNLSSVGTGNTVYQNPVPANNNLPPSFFMSTTAHPSGGTGLSWWKVCTTWTTFPTSCATTQTNPFPPIGPDVTGGPTNTFGGYPFATVGGGYAYDIPATLAYEYLPIDTSYQNSYTISSSSWSNVSGTCSPAPAPCEILTVSGLPSQYRIMGPFQLSGVNAACSNGATIGNNSEIYMTSSNGAATVTYSLTTNPGVSCTGTMKWPDVRQFDERVYETDTASSVNPGTIMWGVSHDGVTAH